MADRAALLRLVADLERDLAAADSLITELRPHREGLGGSTDVVLLGYAAMTIHRAYTSLESCFERICRTLEGSMPVGPDSHRALLHDMTRALEGIRPRVLRDETEAALGPVLKFRHFVRHAYAVAWDAKRIASAADDLFDAWPAAREDLLAFKDFATQTAGAMK